MQEIGYRAPRRSLLDDGSWEVDFYRYDVSTIPAMVLNTNEGRDIYSMDSWQKMPYPVSAIGPGYHSFDTSKDEGPGSKRSVFYTSARHGNLTRARWSQVKYALNHASGLGNIDGGAVSKFGGRAVIDADDNEPAWSSLKEGYIVARQADDTGKEPRLVVDHGGEYICASHYDDAIAMAGITHTISVRKPFAVSILVPDIIRR